MFKYFLVAAVMLLCCSSAEARRHHGYHHYHHHTRVSADVAVPVPRPRPVPVFTTKEEIKYRVNISDLLYSDPKWWWIDFPKQPPPKFKHIEDKTEHNLGIIMMFCGGMLLGGSCVFLIPVTGRERIKRSFGDGPRNPMVGDRWWHSTCIKHCWHCVWSLSCKKSRQGNGRARKILQKLKTSCERGKETIRRWRLAITRWCDDLL